MPASYIFTMEDADLQRQLNVAKEAVLHAMEYEGLLKISAEKACMMYAVVIQRPGLLGRLIDKLIGLTKKDHDESGRFHIRVVKMVDQRVIRKEE